eukprot:196983-Hanusia_phi.AAC.1
MSAAGGTGVLRVEVAVERRRILMMTKHTGYSAEIREVPEEAQEILWHEDHRRRFRTQAVRWPRGETPSVEDPAQRRRDDGGEP